MLRALGVMLLAAALSGCWLQLGAGSANTRHNGLEDELTRDNVTTLAEDWRAPIDSSVTEPIVSGSRVFVTNRDYDDSGETLRVLAAQAYDRGTGELLWERSLLPSDGSAVRGDVATPAYEDGALWVPYWHEGLGPCGGRLARLDPATGAVLSAEVTGSMQSAVVMAGSTAAYMEARCTGGPQLVVRDQATRAVLWTHSFPSTTPVATPTIGGGRLFLNTGETLYAFDADGCGSSVCPPLWTEATVGSFFAFLRPAAGPGDSLITIGQPAPESADTVIVRDAATGDVRWQGPERYTGSLPGAIGGVAVAGDTIYVAGARADETPFGNEAILDAYPVAGCGQATCEPTWTASFGATRPAREPTVAGGVVYVPLVPTDTTAPAVAAADADGCGSSTCSELVRVPLVGGSGPFITAAQPYVTSVAEGGVFVGWLPDLHGSTLSQLIALSPGGS